MLPRQLALLPNEVGLHKQILVGDLARLRAAYAAPGAFRAALVGVWLPDTLVYRGPDEARADAGVFNARLPRAALSDDPHTHFEDIVGGLHARVASGRVVLITGRLPNPNKRGIWRELLERGDLAVLVRRPLPG